jgi:PAS domain S-box-containing protein
MARDDEEERLLRSVALQNPNPILVARQRAAQEVVESKESLERKTEELTRANRRLALMAQVANNLILSEAPPDHLKAAFHAIAAEIGADYYFNYRVDPNEPGILDLESSRGLDPEQQRSFRRIDCGKFPSGLVATSRRPVIFEDVQGRDDELTAFLRALGVKAYAGLPLIAHGHLFGTIAFAATGKTAFAEAEIELLKTLTDQCAATLDRDRLLARLRESDALYRAAMKAGRTGAWETDYAAGTRTWSEEGMALFGLDLVDGRGILGGETDEYRAALHPDDRHLVEHYRQLADEQDSFAAEYRIVRPDGAMLWLSGRGQVAARRADGRAQRLISIMVDITERKKTEEHIQFLMREMSHRSKNLLSVIQAIAGQTVRSAGTIGEFEKRFSLRLRGLAASHDILVDQAWHGAPLADLVCLQLAPFVEDDNSRVGLAGPEVVVTTHAAQAIGLALHELATNAAKYGALSTPGGRIEVSWMFAEHDGEPRCLRLSWIEQGGPPVAPPSSKGFGHIVVERMVASSLGGSVVMDFAPEGLRWTLSIPAADNIVGGQRAAP